MIAERTFNKEEIEEVIFHPDVIRLSTENGVKGEIDVIGTCWIGVYIDSKIVGVFVFEPLNKVSLDSHCYFLPEHRKTISEDAYKLAVSFMFKEFNYTKLLVKCSTKDWHVKNFCFNHGFKLEGILEKSTLFKNKLVDEYLLGMTKDQFLEYTNV